MTFPFDESKELELKELLLSEFDDFMNENVDYSKIHLEDNFPIKEYKLKR